MKKIFSILTAVFLFLSVLNPLVFAENQKTILYFSSDSCPHCANVEAYFEKEGIYKKYPVSRLEISKNEQNLQKLEDLISKLKVEKAAIPIVFFGDYYLLGDKEIIANFKTAADSYLAGKVLGVKTPQLVSNQLTPIFVIVGAIVNALNPCALAALIILLGATAITVRDKVALWSGLSFAFAIFLSYTAMGLGLYHAIISGSFSLVFFKFMAAVAIIFGLLNLKDWLWYGKGGFVMEMPRSWRPIMQKLLRSVTNPVGAFVGGLVVSLFLLPCASGPYVAILSMLAGQNTKALATLYLLLYNLVLVTPMVAITLFVYFGIAPEKFEQIRMKKIRTIHLLVGILLVLIGIFMLFSFS